MGMTPKEKRALKTRIVSDPQILGGTPVVIGTRVPVDNILAAIHAKRPHREIFVHYPSLPPDGIEVCLEWERDGRPL